MIEKISLGLMNESGETLDLSESPLKIESKLEIVTAETYTKIIFAHNAIDDVEIKLAEKFNFALYLKNYLKEIK